jgi:hypothetical protein
VFETDFREKAADTAKFTAFFPAIRETMHIGRPGIYPRQAARSCCRERDMLEKDVALAAATYSMNGWIPLSPE